jgi:hypothetical protein
LHDDYVAGVVSSNTKEYDDEEEGTTTPSARGGDLRDALISGTKEIQTLRFQFACQVFNMHRLDIGEQSTTTTTITEDGGEVATTTKIGKNEGASGVGKILGLPLPHAGPVLYGVIPAVVPASSLRLVALLTQLVARCLGVILPHPISDGKKGGSCGGSWSRKTSENHGNVSPLHYCEYDRVCST